MRLLLKLIRNFLQTDIITENVVTVRKAATDVNVMPSLEQPVIKPDVKEPFYKKSQILEPAPKDYVTYTALEQKSPLINKPYLDMLKYEHSVLIYGDLSQNVPSDYLKSSSLKKPELLQGRQLVGILTSKRDSTKVYFKNSEEIEIIWNELVNKKSNLVLIVMEDEVLEGGVVNSGNAQGVSTKDRGPVKEGLEKMANSRGFKEVSRLDLIMKFYKECDEETEEKRLNALLEFIDQYKKNTGIELSYSGFEPSASNRDEIKGFFRIYQKMDSAHFNGDQGITTFMSSGDKMDLSLSIAETTRDSQYQEEFLNIVKDYPPYLLDKHSKTADSHRRFKYEERLDLKDRIIALGHDKNPSLKNKLRDGCANWPNKFAECEKEVETIGVEEEAGVGKIGGGE